MVHVETTPATTPDDHLAAVVHASVQPRNLLPSEPLVDQGYTDAHVLVASQRHSGVTMVGPVADDPGWQAREGTGFDTSQFVVDWERPVVTCPAGQQSIAWLPHTYPASGMAVEARCARKDCTPCAFRVRCTRAKVEPRMVGLQVREPDDALPAARKRQTTAAFQHAYAGRSGIESTHEQAIRRCGLRRSRSIGLAKTHRQHLLTAMAINLVRLSDWWAGISPAKPRCSPLAALPWGTPSVHHM
jgi:transposase